MGSILRAAAFALLASFCAFIAAADEKQPGVGDMAPAPLGLSRAGDKLDVSQFRGKVLVVTFWASWCAPCRAEMPVLEGLQITMGKEKVQVVAINVEERDQYKRILRGMPALALTIAHDIGKSASTAYGVKGIPHLLIIDRDGKIVRKHIGYSEASIAGILEDINKALAAA